MSAIKKLKNRNSLDKPMLTKKRLSSLSVKAPVLKKKTAKLSRPTRTDATYEMTAN